MAELDLTQFDGHASGPWESAKASPGDWGLESGYWIQDASGNALFEMGCYCPYPINDASGVARMRRDLATIALATSAPQLLAELKEARARIKELEAERDEIKTQKDGAYLERNTCVAAMAKMALALGLRAVKTKTAIEGWSEDWHGCVYIEFPTFQASWHFHDSQAYLFEFLPEEPNQWDGHTTEEKYQNLRNWSKGGPNA